MNFPLDTPQQIIFLKNARRDNSARTRRIIVRTYSLLAALASSIATVRRRFLTCRNPLAARAYAYPLDQCEAPPNFKELADTSGRGLNYNGAICLQNQCMWVITSLLDLSLPLTQVF